MRRRMIRITAGLCAVLLAGCTANVPPTEIPDLPTEETAAETTAETTAESTAESTAVSETEPAVPSVTVEITEEKPLYAFLENPAGLEIEAYTVSVRNTRYYPYDDTTAFYLLYEQDEKGCYFVRLEKHTASEDGMAVQMMELIDRCDSFQLPDDFAWTDTGFVLTGRDTMVNVLVSDAMWGTTVVPPEESYSSFARSPDGTYTAYMKRVLTEEGYVTDAGSLYLRDAAGNVLKLFTNRGVHDENGVLQHELDQPGADVLHAEVVGFMDETHLLCSLTDYGNPCGVAIYDIETGTWSEYRGKWSLPILHDGYAYLRESDEHGTTVGLWRMDKNGESVCLTADKDFIENTVGAPLERCGTYFSGGVWFISPFAQPETDIEYLFSADLQTHLATLEYAVLPDRFRYTHHETVAGNTILIGFDIEQVNDDPMPPPSERTFPPYDYSEESMVVVREDGALNITAAHTGTERHVDYRYDDRYVLVVCFDLGRDADGNLTGGHDIRRLKLLDISRGGFADDIDFPMQALPLGCTYWESGECMLYNRDEVWQITVTDGKLSAEPLAMDGESIAQMEKNGRYFYSPDGKWRAVATGYEGADESGIILRDASGEFHRICTDVNEHNAQTYRCHAVLGFLDDTHLAYTVAGYESMIGWGIYDTETKTHVTGSETAVGIYDGSLYVCKTDDYLPHTLLRVAADGTKITLAEQSDAPAYLFPGKPDWYYRMYSMQNGLWIIMAYEDLTGGEIHYNNTHTYIVSADTKTLRAEILVGYKTDSDGDFWYTDGTNLVLVKP